MYTITSSKIRPKYRIYTFWNFVSSKSIAFSIASTNFYFPRAIKHAPSKSNGNTCLQSAEK